MEIGMSDDLLTSDLGTFGDLITVAAFDDSVSASLAMNRLQDAGVPAVLSHENAVTWFWYLSIAIGGIEVQVNAQDAKAARSLIEAHVQSTEPDADAKAEAGPGAEEMTGDEVPEFFTADPEAETKATNTSESDQEPPEEEPPLTQRERNADRAARAAVLGVVFFPLLLQLYALYLLLFRVFPSEETLDHRHKHRSILAGVLCFVVLVGSYLQWRLMAALP
jgi:hypothetical protein